MREQPRHATTRDDRGARGRRAGIRHHRRPADQEPSAQARDSPAANYGIYNGQVAATADREQVGSTIDAGFTAGEVDNLYPLARVEVATAGTDAAASPADTGPFAQAVFAGQNVQPAAVRLREVSGHRRTPRAYSAGLGHRCRRRRPPPGRRPAGRTAPGGDHHHGSARSQPRDGSDGGTASDSSLLRRQSRVS